MAKRSCRMCCLKPWGLSDLGALAARALARDHFDDNPYERVGYLLGVTDEVLAAAGGFCSPRCMRMFIVQLAGIALLVVRHG